MTHQQETLRDLYKSLGTCVCTDDHSGYGHALHKIMMLQQTMYDNPTYVGDDVAAIVETEFLRNIARVSNAMRKYNIKLHADINYQTDGESYAKLRVAGKDGVDSYHIDATTPQLIIDSIIALLKADLLAADLCRMSLSDLVMQKIKEWEESKGKRA